MNNTCTRVALASMATLVAVPASAHVDDGSHVHAWLDGIALPLAGGEMALLALAVGLTVVAVAVWRYTSRR